MPEASVGFRTVGGFPLIKLEGELKISTLNYIHLIANGASSEGKAPVIIDVTKQLTISDELKKTMCERQVDWLGRVILVFVGPPDRTAKIKQILNIPHQLRYAANIDQGIEELSNLGF